MGDDTQVKQKLNQSYQDYLDSQAAIDSVGKPSLEDSYDEYLRKQAAQAVANDEKPPSLFTTDVYKPEPSVDEIYKKAAERVAAGVKPETTIAGIPKSFVPKPPPVLSEDWSPKEGREPMTDADKARAYSDLVKINAGAIPSEVEKSHIDIGPLTVDLTSPGARTIRQVAAGAGMAAEGLIGALQWVGVDAAKPIADKLKAWNDYASVPDPNFFEQLASGAGSQAVYWIPGFGSVGLGKLVASVAPRIVTAMGFASGVSTFLESAGEAGSVYREIEQANKTGKSYTDPDKAAFRVFAENVALLAITNKLGVFSEKAKTQFRKALKSAPMEALQEFWQEVISNTATGKPPFQGAVTSGLIGGILGAGGGYAFTGEHVGEEDKSKLPNLPKGGIPGIIESPIKAEDIKKGSAFLYINPETGKVSPVEVIDVGAPEVATKKEGVLGESEALYQNPVTIRHSVGGREQVIEAEELVKPIATQAQDAIDNILNDLANRPPNLKDVTKEEIQDWEGSANAIFGRIPPNERILEGEKHVEESIDKFKRLISLYEIAKKYTPTPESSEEAAKAQAEYESDAGFMSQSPYHALFLTNLRSLQKRGHVSNKAINYAKQVFIHAPNDILGLVIGRHIETPNALGETTVHGKYVGVAGYQREKAKAEIRKEEIKDAKLVGKILGGQKAEGAVAEIKKQGITSEEAVRTGWALFHELSHNIWRHMSRESQNRFSSWMMQERSNDLQKVKSAFSRMNGGWENLQENFVDLMATVMVKNADVIKDAHPAFKEEMNKKLEYAMKVPKEVYDAVNKVLLKGQQEEIKAKVAESPAEKLASPEISQKVKSTLLANQPSRGEYSNLPNPKNTTDATRIANEGDYELAKAYYEKYKARKADFQAKRAAGTITPAESEEFKYNYFNREVMESFIASKGDISPLSAMSDDAIEKWMNEKGHLYENSSGRETLNSIIPGWGALSNLSNFRKMMKSGELQEIPKPKFVTQLGVWLGFQERAFQGTIFGNMVSRMLDASLDFQGKANAKFLEFDKLWHLPEEQRINVTRALREYESSGSTTPLDALSPNERAAANKWIEYAKDVRERFVAQKRAEILDGIGVNHREAAEKILAGRNPDDVWQEHPRLKETGKAIVMQAVDELRAAEHWGLENYVTHAERGHLHLIRTYTDEDGKVIQENVANAESVSALAAKAAEYLAKHPETTTLDFTDEFSAGIGFTVPMSVKQYGMMMKRLQQMFEKDAASIKRILATMPEVRIGITPTKKYSVFFEHREGTLEGENDLWKVIPQYIFSVEKKLALDPLLKESKGLISKGDPQSVKQFKEFIDGVKGKKYTADVVVDEVLAKLGLHTAPFALSRTVSPLNAIQTVLKLAFRPASDILNYVSGMHHILVKTSLDALKKGIDFAKTAEGIAIWEEDKFKTGYQAHIASEYFLDKGMQSVVEYTTIGRSAGERVIRKENYFAGFIWARENLGMDSDAARRYAITLTRLSQAVYNIESLPRIARGPLGRTILKFKPWMINEIQFMAELQPSEWGKYLAGFMAIGGPRAAMMTIKSLPIMLLFGLGKHLDDLENWLNKNFPRLSRGVPGLLGYPLGTKGYDVSAPASWQLPQSVTEWFGPLMSDISRFYTTVLKPYFDTGDFSTDRLKEAIKNSSPATMYLEDLVESVIKGEIRDDKGRPLYSPSTSEKIGLGLGFQPTEGTIRKFEKRYIADIKTRHREAAQYIIDGYLDALESNDFHGMNKYLEYIREYQISRESVEAEWKRRHMEHGARLYKSLPKSLQMEHPDLLNEP